MKDHVNQKHCQHHVQVDGPERDYVWSARYLQVQLLERGQIQVSYQHGVSVEMNVGEVSGHHEHADTEQGWKNQTLWSVAGQQPGAGQILVSQDDRQSRQGGTQDQPR